MNWLLNQFDKLRSPAWWKKNGSKVIASVLKAIGSGAVKK